MTPYIILNQHSLFIQEMARLTDYIMRECCFVDFPFTGNRIEQFYGSDGFSVMGTFHRSYNFLNTLSNDKNLIFDRFVMIAYY